MAVVTEEKKRRKEEKETHEHAIGNEDSSFILHSSSFPVLVRPYKQEDYPTVLALWEEAKLRPYQEYEIERLLGSGGGALVAVVPQDEPRGAATKDQGVNNNNGQVVGVILWSHNGSVGILWRLAVVEHQRGRGIATKLLDRAEQDIYKAGLSGVTLLTRVTNTIARSMYTKRGYKHNTPLEFWGKKLPDIASQPAVNEEQTSC